MNASVCVRACAASDVLGREKYRKLKEQLSQQGKEIQENMEEELRVQAQHQQMKDA